MREQIRQGDVLLVPIDKPIGKLDRVLDEGGKPVDGMLVEGERTGHAHRLSARVYDTAGKGRVLMLERPGTLTHEEHRHVEVPAGWWEVRVQREYESPARNARRRD
jgi:hypothetical protein